MTASTSFAEWRTRLRNFVRAPRKSVEIIRVALAIERKVDRRMGRPFLARARRAVFDTPWVAKLPGIATLRQRRRELFLTGDTHPSTFLVARQVSSGRRDTAEWVPPEGLLPWFSPLAIEVLPSRRWTPAINVLLPGLGMRHMSGGPNTALHLAYQLAAAGIRVRLIATSAPLDGDLAPLWSHILGITGATSRPDTLDVCDAHDRRFALEIGENDLFMATAWWTAQMAKYACRHTRHPRFLYLIQDYETLLHPASTPQALATETYALDHVPIVNSSPLLEYLKTNQVGRFADAAFADAAIHFEPAVDRSRFFPAPAEPGRPRRLLFYTRPTGGVRNLFELGVAALMKAAADGAFEGERWEILGMGEAFEPIRIDARLTLSPTPWLSFDGYAAQMRQSDVLLSLMLSPHPSYPPLEMAACGGTVITTSFGAKSAKRLAALSPQIVGVSATVDSIADAIGLAARSVKDASTRIDRLTLPGSWDASLAPVVQALRGPLHDWWDVPRDERTPSTRVWPAAPHEVTRNDDRATRFASAQPAQPGIARLLSFVTPVWNTDPSMLQALAESILLASDGSYEWVIVDNGSTSEGTRSTLEEVARHPAVRLYRSDENLGIIRGTRKAMEIATGRYVAFVDHDDLVSPDCARVLADAIIRADYPPLLYTDEDKVLDGKFLAPYFKPDWDPVLFVNSCYTAHLSVVDRALALALDTHTDPVVEGSHDWDAFVRFVVAGHVPVHVPELLYSWRMHPASTAADLASKPYVIESQRAVLQRFVRGRGLADRFDVVQSPWFQYPGDWWIRRRPDDARSMRRVRLGGGATSDGETRADSLTDVRAAAEDAVRTGQLVHLLWDGVTPVDGEWVWEATGLFELFPDTAMVGGRVHDGEAVRDAGAYFGFGRGCDSPDVGRSLGDPGYFSHHLKAHSVSAVPLWHAVVNADFLVDALQALDGTSIPCSALGPWLGAHARRTGGRVVYSPALTATVTRGWTSPLAASDLAQFVRVNADLLPERTLMSERLGRTSATAYEPQVRSSSRQRVLRDESAHASDLALRERVRAVAARPARPTFSILTTLYEGTDGGLLRATADSIQQQLRECDEWILLGHGTLNAGVVQVLSGLADDPRVRIHTRPDNIGIGPGLRFCLEQARADYVSAVDGDDILTPDALHVLGEAIVKNDWPPLLYSDEDVLDEMPASPYRRPDYDPILNAESSYAWHLLAIGRAHALAHGVFGDTGSNYAQDWDTMQRLAAVGPVVHVPEVLYHWRRHTGSSTHTATVHPGSAASVRHLLEQRRSRLDNPALFELVPFPLDRGMPEPYLARRRVDPVDVGLVEIADPGDSDSPRASTTVTYEFRAAQTVHDGANLVASLLRLLETTTASLTAICRRGVVPDEGWIWEAVRLHQLHRATAVWGGRVVTWRGDVAEGCLVLDRQGRLVDPFAGRNGGEPGPFALALKPHQAAAVSPSLFVIESGLLRDSLRHAPAGLRFDDLGVWLSATAWTQGRSVVYSPLISARCGATHTASDGSSVNWSAAERVLERILGCRRFGLAGFLADPVIQ